MDIEKDINMAKMIFGILFDHISCIFDKRPLFDMAVKLNNYLYVVQTPDEDT